MAEVDEDEDDEFYEDFEDENERDEFKRLEKEGNERDDVRVHQRVNTSRLGETAEELEKYIEER